MRKLLVSIILIVFVISMVGVCLAATKTVGAQSSITRDGMNAKQNLGKFEVPTGGKAYAFSGNASLVDSRGVVSNHFFSIEKYDGAKNIVVFHRNANDVDSPVALSKLVLGPGKYVLVIGGYPGSTAQISFTLEY